MIRMKRTAVCFLVMAIAGCAKDDFKLTPDMVEVGVRSSGSFVTNAPKKIAEMSADDVIVAVNGYPLTKRAYDDFMELRLASINKTKGMTPLVANQMMDEYRVNYVKTFIAQRLLIDEAFKLGVVTEGEVLSAVERRLKEDARKRGKKVADTIKDVNGKDNYLFYELSASYTMDKFIAEKIPPALEVTPEFVAAVQEQVTKDNADAQATNAFLKARLAAYRGQILAKELDFTSAAKAVSQAGEEDGIWGEFEEGEMDDPGVQAKVFALKEGEVSDVLEDENGLHIVKVLSVTPAVKNDSGRVVARERRKLAHIYLEKVPLLIRLDDIKMSADLKMQMQMQAVNAYVTGLSTNNVNKIEYPNGNVLF